MAPSRALLAVLAGAAAAGAFVAPLPRCMSPLVARHAPRPRGTALCGGRHAFECLPEEDVDRDEALLVVPRPPHHHHPAARAHGGRTAGARRAQGEGFTLLDGPACVPGTAAVGCVLPRPGTAHLLRRLTAHEQGAYVRMRALLASCKR